MRCLVTGGAGFIGSHIVDGLVSMGHDVSCVDNFLTGSRDNLNPKARFYESDITNLEKLKEVFEKEKPEYVFHAAAGYLVQSIENPQRDAMVNIIGSINIAELCVKFKVKKLIYSNSGGASYGDPLEIPMTEEHSVNPLTPYGASKHTAEHYFYMYHKNYGLNYTSLRYANIYGPRQNPKLEGGVISVFMNALMRGQRPEMKSDGTLTRDYCYVGDVVDANIMAIERGECDGYHVSTGIETSVLDLYKTMQKVLNTNIEVVKGKPRIGDPQRAVFSNKKIKEKIGWAPKTSLEEGIKKTAEWMKEQIKKENEKVNALILAAGIGERMLPLTKDTPKPMLKIEGKPVLEYTISLLKKYGIKDIGMTTCYLKEKIIDYFKDGKGFGVNLTYLKEPELIPSGRAIKQMKDFAKDAVVIINGDNVTDINISKLIDFHKAKNADITIVSYLRAPDAKPSSQLDFGEDSRLTMFRERLTEDEMKAIPESKRFANAGIYIFNKNVIESISDNEDRDLGHLFPGFLEKGAKIYVYPNDKDSYFGEIGKIEKFEKIRSDIESGRVLLKI
jgi:UDP-glucose 4-epimerase